MVYDKVVDYAKAGRRIKMARVEHDWSQEDLAARADVSVTFLSNVENAHSKGSLATFVKIANALGKGVDDIICDSISVCREELNSELVAVTKDCSDLEMRVIVGVVSGLKRVLRDTEEYKKRIDDGVNIL